ncbi:MAG: ABC transporter permease, partial [Firmicutes bacterium]|nr:ABC transporter permease [Bacillota bacterium]
GVFMGRNKKIEAFLSPLISILYPIPALGWLPLLMIWLGINELLPVIIVFICSFFPIMYNTLTGVKNVDPSYIKAAKIAGATDRELLWEVIIPLALPDIFTGLRLEAGMAWRVIIAAEMIAIPTGIGVLLMRAESLIRVDIILVCLMVLSLMCYLFERVIVLIEQKITSWR